jgi:RNA polymerase sigma factor (sigma-70 family)
VNLVLQRRRRLENHFRHGSSPSQPGIAVALDDSVVARRDIAQALAALPPKHRAEVVLRFFEDLAEEATAEILGVPVGTVKSRLSRALVAMRSNLEGGSNVSRR